MKTLSGADRAYRLLLAGAVALALLLRLINLGAEPFWGDEALSLDIAHHFIGAPAQLFEYLKETEAHPPLYYLLLQAWTPLFGLSEASARFPSLLFSLGAVLAAAWLAKVLFGDRRTAVIAAFIVAVLPLQIEFGHEARPYAILGFLALMSVASCWKYLRTGQRRWAILYAIAGGLGLNLHYSFLFVLAPLALWWLYEALRSAPSRRKTLLFDGCLAHAAVALAFAWWLDAFLFKILLGHVALSDLPGRFSDAGRAPDFFGQLAVSLVWTTKQAQLPKIELFGQLLCTAAVLAAAVFAVRGAKKEAETARPWLFLSWVVFGALASFMLSPAAAAYTPLPAQHLLCLSALLAIALARLLAALPPRLALPLAALFLATLLPRVADIAGNDAAWDRYYRLKAAAQLIDQQARPGDLVLIAYANSRTDLDHYLRPDLEAVALLPLSEGTDDSWRSRETLGFYEQEFQLRIAPIDLPGLTAKIDRLSGPAKRVWIYGLPDEALPAVDADFRRRGWRIVMPSLGDLSRLALYARNETAAR